MPMTGVYQLHKDVELPKFATDESAGFDLQAYLKEGTQVQMYDEYNYHEVVTLSHNAVLIPERSRVMIPTGLIFDIPIGFHLELFPRSGNAWKMGLNLANGTGIVDSDYINEVMILLQNTSSAQRWINHGDRIAQGIIKKTEFVHFEILPEPPAQKTNRSGGMGHTGR